MDKKLFSILLFYLVSFAVISGKDDDSATIPAHYPDFLTENIDSSIVYAERDARHIVKDMARFFSSNYARDYISLMTVVRTSYSGDRCRNLSAVTGIWGSVDFTMTAPKLYFDDKSSYTEFYPLDAFITNNYFPDRQEVNNMIIISGDGLLEYLYKDMDNSLSLMPLIRKRALELYSPLNPKHVNDYHYEVKGSKASGDGVEYAISFRSKNGVFPKKNRIYCSGILHISKDGLPLEIEVYDMEDRFSSFIRRENGKLPNVTPYTFSISYAITDSKIHVCSVSQKVKWVLPENLEENSSVFYAEEAPFRNPFKYNMSTLTDIRFASPVFLDQGLEWEGKVKSGFQTPGAGPGLIPYVEDTDIQYWQKTLRNTLDMDKISADLKYEGMTLEDQAKANANAGKALDKYRSLHPSESAWNRFMEKNKSRYRFARELSDALFR